MGQGQWRGVGVGFRLQQTKACPRVDLDCRQASGVPVFRPVWEASLNDPPCCGVGVGRRETVARAPHAGRGGRKVGRGGPGSESLGSGASTASSESLGKSYTTIKPTLPLYVKMQLQYGLHGRVVGANGNVERCLTNSVFPALGAGHYPHSLCGETLTHWRGSWLGPPEPP